MTNSIEQAWELAKQRFAAVGVDVDAALTRLDTLPVSMHCWQGDDVTGFENPDAVLTGGIQATGNYPGKARNAAELRSDLELALTLIPGPKRLNLHAIYLESDTPVARNKIEPRHFNHWVEWAKKHHLGLDFNPSCFSHPLSADGFTLSHTDPKIRQFWIEHCQASRRVSAYFGEQLGTASVMNIWIPDGMKDTPIDRLAPRQRLLSALDEVISEKLNPAHHIDAVESKLFGIGAESYTVGSNEFYMAMPPAAKRHCAWMPVTSIPLKSFPTKYPAPCCMSRAYCCMSAAQFVGTVTTWCCWMMKHRLLPVKSSATTCLIGFISVWTSLMPRLTALPLGSLAPAT